MKMKNIFLGLVSLFFLGAVTSCDSFLEEKPQQDMSLGQYYKTANHARAGVNALYALLSMMQGYTMERELHMVLSFQVCMTMNIRDRK